MIVCAERTLEDFYVIVHEMGHIQYYMAYERQPVIFRVRESNILKICMLKLSQFLKTLKSTPVQLV